MLCCAMLCAMCCAVVCAMCCAVLCYVVVWCAMLCATCCVVLRCVVLCKGARGGGGCFESELRVDALEELKVVL